MGSLLAQEELYLADPDLNTICNVLFPDPDPFPIILPSHSCPK
jgi:hypothetical protein